MALSTMAYYRKKKGSLLDIFPIIVILMITVITLLICYKVWIEIDETTLFDDDVYANESMAQVKNVLLAYDNLTIFIFLMLSAVTIVLASRIASNPAWFFIALFILVIAFIVAAVMSNAYEDVSTTPELNQSAANFPKTGFLMDKLPLYVLLMMFCIAISMYAGYKIGI